jgi:hypothetical protein
VYSKKGRAISALGLLTPKSKRRLLNSSLYLEDRSKGEAVIIIAGTGSFAAKGFVLLLRLMGEYTFIGYR